MRLLTKKKVAYCYDVDVMVKFPVLLKSWRPLAVDFRYAPC